VNIVKWLVSVPVVRVFVGSTLTISFELACRDYSFDGNTFNVVWRPEDGATGK